MGVISSAVASLKGRLSCAYLLSLTFFVLGCATSGIKYVEPDIEPVSLRSAGSEPISFKGVIIRVPAGTKIGSHHDGLLKISKFPYYWQSNLMAGSEEFNLQASEELRAYGYTVLGGDNLLFGEDQASKARYQLGGTINDLEYHTYGSLAGNYTEASVTVEWQLFDALRKEVRLKDNTTGYGKISDVTSQAVFVAFRRALNNLMARGDFVAILKKGAGLRADTAATWEQTIGIQVCKDSPAVILPENMEKILDGVVTIRVGSSFASGVIVSHDGYILTAAHVVSGVKEVAVGLKSGLTLTANVIRTDVAQDIALIKIPGMGHSCLPLALSETPAIGTEIYAVGTPASEELALSVSKGIVSGHRTWNSFPYLQTDASLNPGNSGGPLVNKKGQVIGIVSWKIAATGFEGLSFGVPLSAIGKQLGIVWQ